MLGRERRILDRDRGFAAQAVHAWEKRDTSARRGPADHDQFDDSCDEGGRRAVAEADLVPVPNGELGQRHS